MLKNLIVIPKFLTAAEEADGWDAHPEVATEIKTRAMRSGKARRMALLRLSR